VRSSYLFTSESVSEGHPDKVCDRISDEIVDLVFREAKKTGMDPSQVRIACETLATTNRVVIAGEVRVPDTLLKKGKDGKILRDASGAPIVNPAKFKSTARKAIKAIGYEQDGFHWKKARIDVLLHGQSADIAQGVDEKGNKDVGAGDQGIMFGYASRETPELLPAPIYYAHKILEVLKEARQAGNGDAKKLGPDAKSQVTIRYENGVPVGVTQISNSASIGDGTTSATASDTTPVNTTPALSLNKSDGGGTITPGGTLVYTLSYANTGNIGLTGVVLQETVPANTSFNAAASALGWSCAGAS